MSPSQLTRKRTETAQSGSLRQRARTPATAVRDIGLSSAKSFAAAAFAAQQGIPKADAARLFQTVAASSALPAGQIRAELIPDSSWKRAGKTLGPQASQTAARLASVLSFAERVWGNQTDAVEWLNSPHPELRGTAPFALLKTEAGGRAVEALLAALEFGFPV